MATAEAVMVEAAITDNAASAVSWMLAGKRSLRVWTAIGFRLRSRGNLTVGA